MKQAPWRSADPPAEFDSGGEDELLADTTEAYEPAERTIEVTLPRDIPRGTVALRGGRIITMADVPGDSSRTPHVIERGVVVGMSVLEALERFTDPVSQLRRARLHGRHPTDPERLRREPRWREAVRLLAGLDREPLLDMDL